MSASIPSLSRCPNSGSSVGANSFRVGMTWRNWILADQIYVARTIETEWLRVGRWAITISLEPGVVNCKAVNNGGPVGGFNWIPANLKINTVPVWQEFIYNLDESSVTYSGSYAFGNWYATPYEYEQVIGTYLILPGGKIIPFPANTTPCACSPEDNGADKLLFTCENYIYYNTLAEWADKQTPETTTINISGRWISAT